MRRAQDRMKMQADRKRSDTEFAVGSWVWLKLQAYKQKTIRQGSHDKLSSKFYGPFQVAEVIGKVAYKLKLPQDAQIHPVFHVSQLKKFKGVLPAVTHIPSWLHGRDEEEEWEPESILGRRTVKHQNRADVKYLIQWKH